MNYRNRGEDRGEHGRGGYQRYQGGSRQPSESNEQAPWDERGSERGSYSSQHGFRGDSEMESSGRGEWREDFRGPRGGWDEGRVSMEPRGGDYERSSYSARGDWSNPRGESSRGSDTSSWRGGEGSGSTGYGAQGTSYGGMGAGPYEGGSGGGWRGESRAYGSEGTRGGFGRSSGGSDWQSARGSNSDSQRSNGGSWAGGRRWATENAGQAGSGLGFGGEGLGNQSWGPQSFGGNSGWANRAFESSVAGNWSESDRGRHAGKGPKNYRRNDERIKEDASERLKDHPEIDASDIEVEVSSGTITLTGEVRTRREKRLAEDAVESVSGVDDVTNQLRVRSSKNEREDSERDQPNTRSSSSGSSSTGVGPLSSSMSAASTSGKQHPSKGRTIGSSNES